MRNIAGFSGLVIMVLCTQAVAAQETNSYAVSLGYQFGFLYGQAEEIVYPGNNNHAPMLSQLLWDMKPVMYSGLLLDISQARPMEKWGFFSTLSLKYGIPGRSGTMEDRDWQSYENDALTNFSSHDNFTNSLFMADASAGVSIPMLSLFLLKPFLRVSYMRSSFSGFDGYYIYARRLGNNRYAPIDDNPDTATLIGKQINYIQEWLTLALGISIRHYFNSKFSAGLSFMISPLVSCVDLDEHLKTNVQYRDYMMGGLFIQPGAGLYFSINKWLSLSLDSSWRHIKGTIGSTYWRTYGTGNYFEIGSAGAGLSIFDTALSLKVTL
ncbi:MAG: omptin family outer membrane protease [Treponema sp.]|nr:omptin family outer membrane protease [Treponema sp.]